MALLMKIHWFNWHRRIGIATCLGIILWGSSGMAHPVMSYLQPKPATLSPPTPTIDLQDMRSPRQVLLQHDIPSVQRMSVVQFNNSSYYRVSERGHAPARYFSSDDGIELTDGDPLYARWLASQFAGRAVTSIESSTLITEFSDEYHAVNRLLPVWRIQFEGEDQLRAYVDTDQSRLATLVDQRKYWLTRLFSLGHNWSFIEHMPRVQLLVMTIALFAALLSTLSGLYLYIKLLPTAVRRLSSQPVKSIHRKLALLVAVSTMTFVGSGLFHLIISYGIEPKVMTDYRSVKSADLDDTAWSRISRIHASVSSFNLINTLQTTYWLVKPKSSMKVERGGHDSSHHDHASHGQSEAESSMKIYPALKNDGERLEPQSIPNLAVMQYGENVMTSKNELVATKVITHFDDEYGFVFKRLPVVIVQFKKLNYPRYYVEPVTGVISAELSAVEAAESWSFSRLHKWQLLNNAYYLRDVLMMIFAFGNICVAVLGMMLFLRKS